MLRKMTLPVLVSICVLMSCSPVGAQEDTGGGGGEEEGLVIEAGFDLFRTLPFFESRQSFADCPIPGLTFETHSDQPLTGCDTFEGFVPLTGAPLFVFRGHTVGLIDTIVERKSTLDFGEPTEDVTLTTEVELVALNLASSIPISIQCDQGMTMWDVAVEVEPSTGFSGGTMDVTLDYPELTGGTASSHLDICPRVTFTRVDGDNTGSFEFYPCDLLCGPELAGETEWAFEVPEGVDPPIQIEGFTTPNFFFIDAEEAAAIAAWNLLPPKERELQPKVTDCECGFLYPHLSANHRHQACAPCPCDADVIDPELDVPPEPDPPRECTTTGGIPDTDPFVKDWLTLDANVDCRDASGIKRCESVNSPDFFSLGSPTNPSCLGRTPVGFLAVDNCKHRTTGTSHMAVRDTTAPNVSTDGDLACLTPANGGIFTFGQDEGAFELDTIKSQFTDDLCSEVTDWWFAACISDQPDSNQGNGNTSNDCTVGIDNRTISVRSERTGGVDDGRRYEVQIQAMDACGNTSDPTPIGSIFVPLQDPGDGSCIIVQPPCRPTCSGTPESGTDPLLVTFSDDSTGNCPDIVSRLWDFGDGVTATGDNPSHEYDTPGTYNARLELNFGDDILPMTITCEPVAVLPDCSQREVEGGVNSDLIKFDIASEMGITGTFTIDSITQDEVIRLNDGDDCPDAAIFGGVACVRAERIGARRDGGGNGRIYHIKFSVDDGEPPCGGELTVCIPHGTDCKDDKRGIDSTVTSDECPAVDLEDCVDR